MLITNVGSPAAREAGGKAVKSPRKVRQGELHVLPSFFLAVFFPFPQMVPSVRVAFAVWCWRCVHWDSPQTALVLTLSCVLTCEWKSYLCVVLRDEIVKHTEVRLLP